MKTKRYQPRIVVSFLMSLLLTAAAQASETAKDFDITDPAVSRPAARSLSKLPSRVAFAWAGPGVPAVVTVPLPADVMPEEVTSVSVPERVRMLGFSSEHDSRQLVLYLAPATGEVDVVFHEIGIELALGAILRHAVGSVRVVAADARPGPLEFERSLAAPGAGLYLAVALRNTSREELAVAGIEYLPAPLQTGRVLVAAVSDSAQSFAALEQAFTPAAGREGAGGTAGTQLPVDGFAWLGAHHPPVVVPAGEALLLAWTADSLPGGESRTSYRLQPVIEYEPVAADAPRHRLGLPVRLRAP